MKNRSQKRLDYRLQMFMGVVFLATAVSTAQAMNLVQAFYLPMPEQQIYQASSAIIAGTGSTIASTLSIVVTGNGDDANGICPGCMTGHMGWRKTT